ncbi:hypothetical protein LCGC14_2120780 [marine sediment metagenome]|uniref:Uncharacterized protein n=1 Tax=marine sediment metagenome TaxID=412755 RepID=A0A0F9E4E5_9ZZZZ
MTMRAQLTDREAFEVVFAVGEAAGNRSMRKGRRKAWSRKDFSKAARVTNRLLDQMKVLDPNNDEAGRGTNDFSFLMEALGL